MTADRGSSSRSLEEGFTLLEVVVALTLLGIILSVAFGMIAAGLMSARNASEQTRMLLEGRRVLEEVLAQTLKPETRDGVLPGGYRWMADVKPVDPETAEGPVQLFQVRVSVYWPGRTSEKHLDLVTMGLSVKDPQAYQGMGPPTGPSVIENAQNRSAVGVATPVPGGL